MWPSRLRRQIVALKIVGSSPIIHPIKTGGIFGYLLFFIWFIRYLEMMGVIKHLSTAEKLNAWGW